MTPEDRERFLLLDEITRHKRRLAEINERLRELEDQYPDLKEDTVTDDAPNPETLGEMGRSFAELVKAEGRLDEPADGDYLCLPDPDHAPDKHTRHVLALHTLSIIDGHCPNPNCGGAAIHHADGHYSVAHLRDCVGHLDNVAAYCSEHGYTEHDLYHHVVIYKCDDDGSYTQVYTAKQRI